MKSKINTNHEKKFNTRGFGSSFRLHKGVMHFILPDFFSEARNKFKFLSIKTSNWKFKNWNEKNSFKIIIFWIQYDIIRKIQII